MLDFLIVSKRVTKNGIIEIYPRFKLIRSEDLMIRGRDFYAIWLDDEKRWSTDEQDAIQLIDHELELYFEKNKEVLGANAKVMHMWDSETRIIDTWHHYCQKQMRDHYHVLDETLIFSDHEPKKEDYSTKHLNYPLEEGEMPGYEKLMTTLYSEEERHKLEWAIGSIVCGDSKTLQKFVVLYGASGTGKSTVLNIIQQLFDGYFCVFDAKALSSSNNSFALEAFRNNPLVAIQHDGDLSKIEDNTRLNSLVSHEAMIVNEKFKATYANSFKCFLFMGTNKPVKITDAKSGLIRRLIDVTPTGDTLSLREYNSAVRKVKFELGAIAYHCQQLYLENPDYYDDYIPIAMLGASNDFYNFMVDSYYIFKEDNAVTLKAAWEMYKTYCDEAKVSYPFSQRIFKEEMKNYFDKYDDRFTLDDGTRVRSYFQGFRTDKFENTVPDISKTDPDTWIQFQKIPSIFDKECYGCPAQYATTHGTPAQKWDDICTTLQDIDTSRVHYIIPPENHIVIDFDLRDSKGEKSLERNLEEASKWPPTYAELSKSGTGIHLHYIFGGNASRLKREYAEYIEVKTFFGHSALRRRLTKCNNLQIATISSGLPLEEEKKVVNFESIKNEKALRTIIFKNLQKEYHPNTKPSVDFIAKALEDAYNSGIHYDVSDLYNDILVFASNSTNQSENCIKIVHDRIQPCLHSADISENKEDYDDQPLVFYDIEVFPNLFIVCWKYEGDDKPVVKMFNPSSEVIEDLLKRKLVGFNCRRYDNHILYARLMGYDNEALFRLNQKIVGGKSRECYFREAYGLSYTDIYDFSSKKQSLKKFEIELGIHHLELGLPWDQPVSEELWEKVAEYCENDVIATEKIFFSKDRQADFTARQILADVAGMTVNDTTNSLTTRIIFGKDKNPQDEFNYRFMGSNDVKTTNPKNNTQSKVAPGRYNVFDELGRPIFPGYIFFEGKSTYRSEEVGEGGYVYAEPGIYYNVALLDIQSMHPHSVVAEDLFGKKYTKRFKDILDARIAIKNGNYDKAKKMLNGTLERYLTDESSAKNLAQALKIAINSVYGLTAAKFENAFKDPRNVDNIVAKRGALFMINLKHEVQKRGFTVAHIKTDSIKIPDATPEIIQFVTDFGKEYGYSFEHQGTYNKMCLVNDAVYIARYSDGSWDATGTQFAVPYVFKKLFSHEEIGFEDMCETKSVQTNLYLDLNENLPDVSESESELAKLEKAHKKGEVPDDIYEKDSSKLAKKIAKGHNYYFIGKVGQFCPVRPGCNGGYLMREYQGKYYAATGTKGYRWAESDALNGDTSLIDISYYDNLVDDAIATIEQYGEFFD